MMEQNDKYHTSLKGSGMSPLTDDMVGHVQSGYIGGQALALTGDEYTEFMQTGVKESHQYLVLLYLQKMKNLVILLMIKERLIPEMTQQKK